MSYEPDDYRPQQDQRDANYREHYAKWVKELTRANALSPSGPPPRTGARRPRLRHEFPNVILRRHRWHLKIPTSSIASNQHVTSRATKPNTWMRSGFGTSSGDSSATGCGSSNARLALDCLALASGVAFLGDSMSAVGRKHGLSRAAVSKRCIELLCEINLPPSRAMR